jgi:RHS repeat-associated protein
LLRTVGDGSLERKLYDPYGRVVAVPGGSTAGPLPIPFGYAGARWEATAGLYQMGARWYDPELGRFLEQDPIGEAGGLNLYAYVGSSPTLWVDPTGLARQGVGGSVIGGGPVNRTSQRQIIVDGMSTSDMLTGSSGGWLDWGSSHQDEYYGPSKDKPGYNPTTRGQQRAAKRAAAEAKAAADAGEVPDATEATSAVSTSGAAAPLGLAPGQPAPSEDEAIDASEENSTELTGKFIAKVKAHGNDAEKSAATKLEGEQKREKVSTVVSADAAIKTGWGDDRRTEKKPVNAARSFFEMQRDWRQNPKWVGAEYTDLLQRFDEDGNRFTAEGQITIYNGTRKASGSFLKLGAWQTRVFAHEAVHALAPLGPTDHADFPAGIFMGID